ncbi:putative aminophospholipid-translocase [Elasticomyces elasticus]|uniref:P-type phospholipid transporter n=1 Tax=Elasticomyces elasticus TaxID=574655 RepID=A0AAN7VUS1_9PEZI|nr:putative aminophospholipid-translocase [Elasticomyces elasticus]
MNNANGYHAPHHPYADDDEDLDLDLDELDPVQRDTARRIDYGVPLRKLRLGGRRRRQEEDTEDLEALIDGDGEDGKRDAPEEEGQGLLNGGAVRRGSETEVVGDARTRRKRGLWQFMSRRKPAGIALPDIESEGHDTVATRVIVPSQPSRGYPSNAVSNAKYSPWSFLPRTLWNEFKFFFNLYFLLVALSQVLPALRIGYLSTYVAPLAFVICVTLGKEAYDDILRRKRDGEANGEVYRVLRLDEGVSGGGTGFKRKVKGMSERKKGRKRRSEEGGRLAETEREEEDIEDVGAPSARVTEVTKASRDLRVGDILVLSKDQRLPADVVILKSLATESPGSQSGDSADYTSDSDPASVGGGEAFIRTDQLDGETDWKLRLATPLAQTLSASEYGRLRITAGKPERKVNEFAGKIELLPKQRRKAYDPHTPTSSEDVGQAGQTADTTKSAPLNIDNTAWANTVLASSTTVHAVILYTGPQTRAALSTSSSRSKTGLLEHEINSLTKILCALTAALSLVLVLLEKFEGEASDKRKWYVAFMRFLILFSTIVPISLRVNLDMGKSFYAWCIQHDTGIPGTVVRTSTIPEDLGRVEFLLSDKTGTLTGNEMVMRKVHVGTAGFGGEEGTSEVRSMVGQVFGDTENNDQLWTPSKGSGGAQGMSRTRREIAAKVRDLVVALGVCHNVTPTVEEDGTTGYQASSPDEIAIVQWTEAVGLRLAHRDRGNIRLESTVDGRTVMKVEILHVFPFTSESKRMGIVVRFVQSEDDGESDIVFFEKGADTVMTSIVKENDWLEEETGNMAREGLRTLVVGRKALTGEQYVAFSEAYNTAALTLNNRDAGMAEVVKQHLETDLDILGVTGVEDKLQEHVKPSLELLRNAGIKIWMLTGDKVETARCIAISSKLVTRGQYIHTIAHLTLSSKPEAALDALSALHDRQNAALLIDGQSLALYLTHHREAFISIAVRLPAVIACRCTPTQKADVALLIRSFTGKRVACIGDGGNDVSMIQAADIGIGIVGKEGKQASLAADFSITQFSFLTKLLLWHGRNSYKRSAKLAQFVMHRGLIISICQTVFSVASAYEPVALYRDWLLVGYATVYTMFPVFSLVLDRDVDEGLANLYPELYKELTEGKSLSYRTFFVWVGISVYQGLVIQGGSELLVPGYFRGAAAAGTSEETVGFRRMVAVSYTALIVNEVLMVCSEITTWHLVMIASVLGTLGIYFGSLPFLGGYFDLVYLLEIGFWWRAAAVAGASWGPVVIGKVIRRRIFGQLTGHEIGTDALLLNNYTQQSTLRALYLLQAKPEMSKGNKVASSAPSTMETAHPLDVALLEGFRIRIIELLPGTGEQKISIKLSIRHLDEQDLTFDALSYVWGPGVNQTIIQCHDREREITGTLHAALRRVRLPNASRLVWADAICINQTNLPEKSHHVRFMDRVYAKAENVLVCMGDDKDGGAANVLALLNEHGRRKQRYESLLQMPALVADDPILRDERWDSVGVLTRNPWFGRAWVIQEVGKARNPIVLYGKVEFSYRALMQMLRWVVRCASSLQQTARIYLLTIHTDWEQWTADWRTRVEYDYTLIDLLSHAKGLGCSKSHDHVYSLLGHPLLRTGDNEPQITPNYDAPAEEAFQQLAAYLLTTLGLKVLSAVEHTTTSIEGALPSWVPRWDMDVIWNSFGYFAGYHYRASGPEEGKPYQPWLPSLDATQPEQLRVNALYLDKVEAVFAFPMDQPADESRRDRPTTHDSVWDKTLTMEVVDGAKDIVKILEDINKHLQSRLRSAEQWDNLSLTLAAGLSNYGSAETNLGRHRADFRAFWKVVVGVSSESGSPVAAQNSGDADAFWFNVSLSCKGRSFFTTSKGYCGLGPSISQRGDLCYIFKSARVPYVVRSTRKDEMTLLGEAYIHGFMNGEAVVPCEHGVPWTELALH